MFFKKMTKNKKIVIPICLMTLGWLFNALAWITQSGHPTSTIFLLLGLGLFFVGLFFLIIALIKK
jgi:CHASE1-domain containing sensor protein